MGMFVHFGMNTYSDREWGLGNEDPRSFNPIRLDATQWVRTAKAAGAEYIVLTAKHHDGFCLWPSRVTNHSVKSSIWRAGSGDVVREVADAAHAARIGLGLYLSPWDRNAESYGSGERYNDFYIAQLTELLSGYGPVMEVWFDGANGEGPGGKRQKYDWARIHATVRRLQPKALIFSDAGPDIRWIGNEHGTAGDPNWCTVDPSIVTEPGLDGPHIISALQHGNPPAPGAVWRPGEADVSIRPGWFHHPAEDGRVKSTDELMEIWFNSVGRNANLLLNVPANRDGLISEPDVRALEAFGKAQRSYWPDEFNRPMPARASIAVMRLRRRTRVHGLMIEEAIRFGQRITQYRVEADVRGRWSILARGTTVGRRKVDRFEPVETTQLRVVVEESFGAPDFDVTRLAAT
jgi:alpha-L-fucosidase